MSADQPSTPVSAAVICFNEEANLRSCLESLGWCDEIVVVDSGSQDRTCDIASSFENVRLFSRPFDTFIAQKNYALDQCQHDWVFSIDADEVVTDELANEICELTLHCTPGSCTGFSIRRRTFLGSRHIRFGNWNPDYCLRFFRRSCARWGGTNPHERVIIDGPTQRLQEILLHYSYRNRQEYVERTRKYALMMAEYQFARGRRVKRGEAWVHACGNFAKALLLKRGLLDGSDGVFLAFQEARASFQKYEHLSHLQTQSQDAA